LLSFVELFLSRFDEMKG